MLRKSDAAKLRVTGIHKGEHVFRGVPDVLDILCLTPPVLLARQQVGGAVQEAPPHRFRELFPAGTLKPRARIMLDDPEPVAERKITRIDLFFKGPVTRQQPTPHSRMIRYFAIMEQLSLIHI